MDGWANVDGACGMCMSGTAHGEESPGAGSWGGGIRDTEVSGSKISESTLRDVEPN